MQSHRFRPRVVLNSVNAGRSITASALIFGLVTVLITAQAISQTRLTRDVDALPQSATAAEQAMAAPSFQAETALSTPVPAVEEADLAAPLPIPFSTLVATQSGNQSTPESSSQSAPAPTTPTTTKTKPQHRGLGVALAAVGSVALAAGITAYAIGRDDFCANAKSGGCPEARDAGLALMPVGAGVAVTGFYLVLRH